MKKYRKASKTGNGLLSLLGISLAILLLSLPVSAQMQIDSPACHRVVDRPCIGLVLGGGGARGGAHVGVIKLIEEMRIPVDLVVGTSMGSFVGGLYATGKSAEEIETLFLETDWNSGYRDNYSRDYMPIRRKRQVDSYPIRLDLGFNGKEVKLPLGLIQGQGMFELVNSLLGFYPWFESFDQLSIPFRAVAADAETAEAVILDKGSLATALQSSMSIPGAVRPIEKDGRMLVDGGIANNLPIDVAKAMGADIVIAVDISAPNLSRDQLRSSLDILNQLSNFLSLENVERQKSLLTEKDIYIRPKLPDIDMLAFNQMGVAIEGGYSAAMAVLPTHPSLPDIQVAVREMAPTLDAKNSVLIDKINLINKTSLADNYLMKRLDLKAGTRYSEQQLQDSSARLYGEGSIARINNELTVTENTTVLDLTVEEKEWGPGYLDFKLAFEDDFKAFSRYQIGMSYRLTNISPYGAEWYTTAELGTEKYLDSEFYWPLGNSDYFLLTSVNYQKTNYSLYENELSLGEVRQSQYEVDAGLGWKAADPMDLIAGTIFIEGEVLPPKAQVDDFGFDKLGYRQTGSFFEINYDSLDNNGFPSKGIKFYSRITRSRDEYLGLVEYSTRNDTEINIAASRGRHRLRGVARAQSFINDDSLGLLGVYELGGFLNLSGVATDSVTGQHLRYASLIYNYEIAKNDFGAIRLPLFLGASYEVGNVWNSRDDISYSDLIAGGSVFVGWDSPIGPAYWGFGKANNGQTSFYLYLGMAF